MSTTSGGTLRIPCVLMRGGTSRGLVFRRDDLPPDRTLWDAIFLAALGSPDPRQLDGVGAGDSHCSKIAVLSLSDAADADVDYLFGEVAITEPWVDYAGNSGNIIAALGLFALEEGWLPAIEPETLVRVRNLNTGKIAEVSVPVVSGAPAEDGDYAIDGVPGRGPRIDMVFPRPEGSLTGKLLPTGEALTTLRVPSLGGAEEALQVTLLDAANPVVLLEGAALGVSPATSVAEINGDAHLLAKLHDVRAAAAVAMGLIEQPEHLDAFSNMVPFPVLLFAPASYPRFDDPTRRVASTEMHLCARAISMGRCHKSLNVTVSVALTSAALVPGTLAHTLSGGVAEHGPLRIGHPSGVIETRGELVRGASEAGPPQVAWVRLGRTARRIMEGSVVIQPHKLAWLRGLLEGRG